MSYYTWDYSFGQADKDALRRAHVDSIYLGVQSTMNQLAQKGVDVSPILNQLRDTDGKYNQMDYEGALASVLKAESTANSMASGASQGIPQIANGIASTYIILATSIGLVLGVAISFLLVKRGIIATSSRRRPRRSRGRRRSHKS